MAKSFTSRCSCGDITFGFDTEPSFIAVCHCLDCKRASGGEAAVFMGVPADDFALTSGTPKGFDQVADSGKKLKRNFCSNCGSRLFTSDLESFPGTVFVMLGSLDDPVRITPRLEMFVKRRLPWCKALDMPQFDAMPS